MKKDKKVKYLSDKIDRAIKEQERFKRAKDQCQLNKYYPWEDE